MRNNYDAGLIVPVNPASQAAIKLVAGLELTGFPKDVMLGNRLFIAPGIRYNDWVLQSAAAIDFKQFIWKANLLYAPKIWPVNVGVTYGPNCGVGLILALDLSNINRLTR